MRGSTAQARVQRSGRAENAAQKGRPRQGQTDKAAKTADRDTEPAAPAPSEHAQPEAASPHRTIGQSNPAVKLYFYHLDHLGTPRVITDVAGQVISKHKYLPFGEELNPPPSLNTHKFTGHERDKETGLDYMLARYYGSDRILRFLSVDPSLGSIHTQIPQSWNRYTYSGNNPVRFFDPDGREYTSAAGKQLKKGVEATGSETGSDVVKKTDDLKEKVDVEESDKALVAVVDLVTTGLGEKKEVTPDKVDEAKKELSKNLKSGETVKVLPGNTDVVSKDDKGKVTASKITIYMGSQQDGPQQLRGLWSSPDFVHTQISWYSSQQEVWHGGEARTPSLQS